MSVAALLMILATPLWALLLHALLLRSTYGGKLARQKLAFVSCLLAVTFATYAALLVDFFLIQGDGKSAFFCASISAMLAHLYFHVFNMSETARRIRLILEIKSGQPVGEYRDETMLEKRLERLFALGQLEMRDGRIRSRRTVLRSVALLVEAHERLLFPARFKS